MRRITDGELSKIEDLVTRGYYHWETFEGGTGPLCVIHYADCPRCGELSIKVFPRVGTSWRRRTAEVKHRCGHAKFKTKISNIWGRVPKRTCTLGDKITYHARIIGWADLIDLEDITRKDVA